MKKSVSRALFLLGLLCAIVGVGLFIYGAVGVNFSNLSTLQASGKLFVAADMSNSTFTILGALIVLLGSILSLIAWIGALIRTATLGRWGWFVCLLLFHGLALLIYIFAGPTTRTSQSLAI